MKKFFLFFAAALFCANVNADQAVTINNGGNATQGHFPVFGENAESILKDLKILDINTIKLPEEDVGRTLSDINCTNRF